MIELTVKFKGEDKKRHSQSFLLYEPVTLSKEQADPILRHCIAEARQSISWVPEDTIIKIDMDIL